MKKKSQKFLKFLYEKKSKLNCEMYANKPEIDFFSSEIRTKIVLKNMKFKKKIKFYKFYKFWRFWWLKKLKKCEKKKKKMLKKKLKKVQSNKLQSNKLQSNKLQSIWPVKHIGDQIIDEANLRQSEKRDEEVRQCGRASERTRVY